MTTGSNRLPFLADLAKKSHKLARQFEAIAAEQAIATGSFLVEAKALCGHGNWATWLKATGISERTARRYMLLYRSGLKSAIVADLGFAAAERYASLGMKLLPADDGAACLAFGDDEIDHVGLAYWWREEGPNVQYWCIQFVDEHEVLHLHHTIPIWLLGAMELGRADRHDLYTVRPVPRSEATEFIERFEVAA